MKNRGFTLIELLVVISIISILSTVVLASLNSARRKADDSKIYAEMDQLKKAFELYRNDNSGYLGEGEEVVYCGTVEPGCTDSLIDKFKNNLIDKKYLSAIPKFKNTYGGYYEMYYFTNSPSNPYNISEWLIGLDAPIFCGTNEVKKYMFVFFTQDDSYKFNLNKIPDCGNSNGGECYCLGV